MANPIDVANEIFCAKANPIILDELAALLKPPGGSLDGDTKSLHSYRGDMTLSKGSSFSSLRCMHSNIKKWRYEAFGGAQIVDACAGGLHDLHNWSASGSLHILSLECDVKLIQEEK